MTSNKSSIVRVTDVATMRAVCAMFADAFDAEASYRGAPSRERYLEQLLAGDAFVALAAIEDGAVVGGLAAYVLPKFEQERSEVYLYDLAVAEAHRREGIATALIEELVRIAASLGAYVVYVQADRGDDAAIALYSRLGTREDVLHFDIVVDLDGGSRGPSNTNPD